MVVAVSLLNDVVHDSRGCYARLDYVESVWIVDVARYRVRVAALRVIRTRGSVMGRVVIGRTNSNRQCYHSKCDCQASSSQQIPLTKPLFRRRSTLVPAIPKSRLARFEGRSEHQPSGGSLNGPRIFRGSVKVLNSYRCESRVAFGADRSPPFLLAEHACFRQSAEEGRDENSTQTRLEMRREIWRKL